MSDLPEESDIDWKWYRASFRVFSDALSCLEISARLELQPTSAKEIGDRISERSSGLVMRSTWLLQSSLEKDEPLDHQLLDLLDSLEPRLERLRELRPQCDMDFFCGFASGNGQGGVSLSPDLLARIAAIPGNGIELDLYPPDSLDLE